jgi:DNA-3-methyladenine glycosylase
VHPLPGHPSAGAAGPALPAEFFRRDALEVAPDLLGRLLVTDDGRVGRIVEVEAYRGRDDPASHAFGGRTARNAAMWGPGGTLYVYFSYGMHWCANAVCSVEDDPQAVLLRAVAPVAGLARMRDARWTTQRTRRDLDLCRGPGRLAQAFGIDRGDSGVDLTDDRSRVRIVADPGAAAVPSARGPRVGISRARDLPWRFWVPGEPAVSAHRGDRDATPPG